MDEEIMPVTEVQEEAGENTTDDDVAHYECAFHILPTVADEEVPGVVDALKTIVTHAGGRVTDEEVLPQYDLAYEIVQPIDGVNHRFNAAYFGWIRFTLAPAALPGIAEELAHRPEVLRHLLIKLTREEAEKPFSIVDLRKPQEEHAEDRREESGEAGATADSSQ